MKGRADGKAAAEFVRKLEKGQKRGDYAVTPHGHRRCKVTKGKKSVLIPSPDSRVSARAILNARALVRRELGITV